MASFPGDLIHDLGAGGDQRSQFPATDDLGSAVEACPASRSISSMPVPWWLSRLTNEVRSLRSVQPCPIAASAQNPINSHDDNPMLATEQIEITNNLNVLGRPSALGLVWQSSRQVITK